MSVNILGINAYHGDVAAALVQDGQLVAAAEEERFRRVKHWAGFPRDAIRACLDQGGVQAEEIDVFAISRRPRANLWRKVLFTLTSRPNAGLILDRLRNRARVADVAGALSQALGLRRDQVEGRMHWVEHHPAHLASTYYVSPFEEAAVCAIDGFGDFVSTSLAVGRGDDLRVREKVYFPHSLGLLYLGLTQYLGFPKYGDEYKVMGLAPYGEPDYVAEVARLIRLLPNGGFELDLSYFRHHTDGVGMTWDEGEPTIGRVYTPKLETLLGPARKPDDPMVPRHEAIAASLQTVFEAAFFHILNHLHRTTGLRRLCLAGGCGMNSVANGKIRQNTPFQEVYIQPAAGDNGTALGAALFVAHKVLGFSRRFVMNHAFWGPEFNDVEVAKAVADRSDDLRRLGCRGTELADDDALCDWTADQLAEGKIVGWFQGRMEWGARALGNRSILADPRRPDMRDIINTKIKFRERFRPFAPSILEEAVHDYFVDPVADPFMIQVYPVRPDKRNLVPAVTHVDGSGRLQTVSRTTNPLYWRLIAAFQRRTGVPIVLNTSFNENEPIVHRPDEALDCFLRTRMDALVLGHYALEKGDAE